MVDNSEYWKQYQFIHNIPTPIHNTIDPTSMDGVLADCFDNNDQFFGSVGWSEEGWTSDRKVINIRGSPFSRCTSLSSCCVDSIWLWVIVECSHQGIDPQAYDGWCLLIPWFLVIVKDDQPWFKLFMMVHDAWDKLSRLSEWDPGKGDTPRVDWLYHSKRVRISLGSM